MAVSIMSVSHLALLSLGLAFSAASTPLQARDSHVELRLMPLGASITQGKMSSDGNGYRKELRDLLDDDGYKVDMVGSRRHGSMDDNAHEGWVGLRIDEIHERAEESVPSRRPNLFTLNAGTNDCMQDRDVDHAGDRIESLLDYLWDASPNSTVVMSTLAVNLDADMEACLQRVNKQYVALAKKLQADDSNRLLLVDMHTGEGPQRADLADETHPNDEGYRKMAKIWLKGINDAASRGWLVAPANVTSKPSATSSDGEPSSTATQSQTASSTHHDQPSQSTEEPSSTPSEAESRAVQKMRRSSSTIALTLALSALIMII